MAGTVCSPMSIMAQPELHSPSPNLRVTEGQLNGAARAASQALGTWSHHSGNLRLPHMLPSANSSHMPGL